MNRLTALILSVLIALAPAAYAASSIDSLPAIGGGGSTYPLPDPGLVNNRSNLWITQGGHDYKIDPLRAGYIFVGGVPPITPYLYQLWWNTGVSPSWIYYYDGAHWLPLLGAGCPIATADSLGCVKVDNTTITITTDGTISTVTSGGTSGPCSTNAGTDGQVCNSTGDSSEWGQRVIGAPGAADTDGSTVTITGGVGTGTGSGAPVNITGGAGGITSGSGGDVAVTGGTPASTSASGGYVYLTGGDSTGGAGAGGVLIQGGSSPGGDNSGSVDLTGGSSTGNGPPGGIQLTGGDADSASTQIGGVIGLATGVGGAGFASGGIFLFTADQANGDSGDITINSGAVATSLTGSGNIAIKTGNSTASSNGATGAILITGGQPTLATDTNESGKVLINSWGAASYGSIARWQFLSFGDATFITPFYSDIPGYSAILHSGMWGGNAGEGAARNFVITGETYGGSDATNTTRNGGDIWITGGGTGSSVTTPNYNSNHSGNLYLGGGYVYDTTKFNYGNVVYKSGQADQSYQVATSGASVTMGTVAGTLLLDGVNSTFTITLPAVPQNGRMIHVTTHGSIGTLTVSAPGGATVLGAPASLAADAGFSMIYRTSNTSWYRYY